MSHSYSVSGPRLPQTAAPISQAVVAGDHCYVQGVAIRRGGDS